MAARLRHDGSDCRIDQFARVPAGGWRGWTERQLAEADVVVVVCTESLHRRVEHPTPDESGATDLALVIDAWSQNAARFVTVVPDGVDEQWVPRPLRGCALFRYPADYNDLVRRLRSTRPPGGMLLGHVAGTPGNSRTTDTPLEPDEQEEALAALAAYAQKLVQVYEAHPISRRYVRPSAIEGDGAEVADVVARAAEILRAEPRAFVLLLGDYGTGKSYFSLELCHELTRRLISSAPDGTLPVDGLIPFYVNLSFARNKANLLKALSLFISRYGITVSERALRHLLRTRSNVVLVLDGLDEIANRTRGSDLKDMALLFEEIRALPNVRVVVTSRTTFFRDSVDEAVVPTTHKLVLSSFTDAQIEAYLRRAASDEASDPASSGPDLLARARQLFTRFPRVHELCRLPIHLFLCLEYLRDRGGSGEDFRPVDLYESFINKNLAVNAPTNPRWPQQRRRWMVQRLAYHMWSNDLTEASSRYFERIIAEAIPGVGADESRDVAGQLMNCSFFARTGDVFRFLHLSFLEYFAAEALVEDLYAGRLDEWARRPLYVELFDFMIQLIQRQGFDRLPLGVIVDSESEEAQSNFLATMYRWPVPRVRVVFETLLVRGKHDLVRCVAGQGLGLYDGAEVIPCLLQAFAAEANSVIKVVVQRLLARVADSAGEQAQLGGQALSERVTVTRPDAERILQTARSPYALQAYRKALLLGDRRWSSTVAAIYLLAAIGDQDSFGAIAQVGEASRFREVRSAFEDVRDRLAEIARPS